MSNLLKKILLKEKKTFIKELTQEEVEEQHKVSSSISKVPNEALWAILENDLKNCELPN